MVANYATGKRRFDSYGTEAAALEAANQLARQLSAQDVLAASLTNEQAADYAAAIQALTPFNVALPAAAAMLAGRHPTADGLVEVVECDLEGRAGGRRVTAKAGRRRMGPTGCAPTARRKTPRSCGVGNAI